MFVTNRFGYFGDEWSSFVLVAGGGEKDGGQCAAKVLLSTRISVKTSIKRQENSILKYMEVTCPISTGGDIFRICSYEMEY